MACLSYGSRSAGASHAASTHTSRRPEEGEGMGYLGGGGKSGETKWKGLGGGKAKDYGEGGNKREGVWVGMRDEK